MQKTSINRLAGLALLVPIVSLAAISPFQMANANPNAGANPTPAQTYASLMGNTHLGVSDQMLQQVTMVKPGVIALRWTTDIPNAAAGKWCVTETPTGPVLASGIINIPSPGQMGQFNIDLSTISKVRTQDKHFKEMRDYLHQKATPQKSSTNEASSSGGLKTISAQEIQRSRMSANEASAAGGLKTIAKATDSTGPDATTPGANASTLAPLKSFFIRVAPVSAQYTGLAMPSNVVQVTIP